MKIFIYKTLFLSLLVFLLFQFTIGAQMKKILLSQIISALRTSLTSCLANLCRNLTPSEDQSLLDQSIDGLGIRPDCGEANEPQLCRLHLDIRQTPGDLIHSTGNVGVVCLLNKSAYLPATRRCLGPSLSSKRQSLLVEAAQDVGQSVAHDAIRGRSN